jgi:hypothetical protein
MTPEQLRTKMEQLNDFVLDAAARVSEGEMVDLSGMDRDVAAVCTKAVSLPPDQARDIQPLMAEMIGNLERLSTALKDYKDNIGT